MKELAKAESVWTGSYKKVDLKDRMSSEEVKAITAKYGNKIPPFPKKITRDGDSSELVALRLATKKWILSKSKDDTTTEYQEFKTAYDKWCETIDPERKEFVDNQLFENGNYNKLRYKYEIRTSFFNFKCFFTGESPNAEGAHYPYLLWVWNSIIISLSVAVIQLLVVALASYAISRFRFTGKKASLMVILTVQVFPGTMAMVALYLLLQYLGGLVPALGIDRKIGLILIYLGGGIPFNIWLVKGYFDTIPKALEESAMIDGATYWQAFTMIIMPLVRPILAVVTILSFVGQYNEFVLASVVLTSHSNFTLPVGLRFFVNAQQDARFGVFAACSIMGSLPIVVLWLALQNQIISGLTGGSVKG
jgi:ABC-type maltose transport system permease subunit